MASRKESLDQLAKSIRRKKRRYTKESSSDSDSNICDENGNVLPCYTNDFVEEDEFYEYLDESDSSQEQGFLTQLQNNSKAKRKAHREFNNPNFRKATDTRPAQVNLVQVLSIYETIAAFVPRDVLLIIFGYLTPFELANCSRVCKFWYKISSEDLLWKYLFEKKGLKVINMYQPDPLLITNLCFTKQQRSTWRYRFVIAFRYQIRATVESQKPIKALLTPLDLPSGLTIGLREFFHRTFDFTTGHFTIHVKNRYISVYCTNCCWLINMTTLDCIKIVNGIRQKEVSALDVFDSLLIDELSGYLNAMKPKDANQLFFQYVKSDERVKQNIEDVFRPFSKPLASLKELDGE